MSVARAARARKDGDRLRVHRQRRHGCGLDGRKRPAVDAFIFYPNRLEEMKARSCMALGGAKVVQVEGNYDEANRRCRELAENDRHGLRKHHAAPVLRRGAAKTAAF